MVSEELDYDCMICNMMIIKYTFLGCMVACSDHGSGGCNECTVERGRERERESRLVYAV
jgi:hypothetical protein